MLEIKETAEAETEAEKEAEKASHSELSSKIEGISIFDKFFGMGRKNT
jgi:hypothetical protein